MVHYYKNDDGRSKAIKGEFEYFASQNKGLFRVGAVNCEDHTAICSKEGITTYPTVRLYPEFPVPTSDIDTGDKFDNKLLKKVAGRFYEDKSIEIT